MSSSRPGRLVLPLLAASVMLAACGDDDTAGAAGGTPADQSATTSAADADADVEAAATPAGAPGGGEVTVGEQTWAFVPTIQCMVSGDEIAIIAGEAVDDPSVEISLDVTPDGQRFDVTIDDAEMFAHGDAVTATIDGTTATGSATLSDGLDTIEARFDLACG